MLSRDGAARKLVGLITRRSLVQIQLPQPRSWRLPAFFAGDPIRLALASFLRGRVISSSMKLSEDIISFSVVSSELPQPRRKLRFGKIAMQFLRLRSFAYHPTNYSIRGGPRAYPHKSYDLRGTPLGWLLPVFFNTKIKVRHFFVTPFFIKSFTRFINFITPNFQHRRDF